MVWHSTGRCGNPNRRRGVADSDKEEKMFDPKTKVSITEDGNRLFARAKQADIETVWDRHRAQQPQQRGHGCQHADQGQPGNTLQLTLPGIIHGQSLVEKRYPAPRTVWMKRS